MKNKTIVITGGSDGLGRAIAEKLVKDHSVIIISPTEEKLKKVSSEIGCEYKVADVSDWESINKAIGEIGIIDVFVNNAGLWIQGELDENDPERISEVIDVNFKGVVYATKSVIPVMKKNKSGQIININSQGGLYGKAERSVYTATKWGITGFTKSIQQELAKYKIRVTDVYPGKMKTEMFSKMNIDKPMDDSLELEQVAKTIEFLIQTDSDVIIPEIGIKNIDN